MLVIVLAYIKVRDMSAGRQTEHSKMELSILTTLGGGGGGGLLSCRESLRKH